MLISIVLPCYNPPANWASNIINQYANLSKIINEPLEVILVEDGFDKKLVSEIEHLKQTIPAFKCIQYEINRGKGYAIRQGVEAAEGEIIIYTDIDFPYTADSLFKLFSALKNKDCEIAVGVKSDAYYTNVPLSRRMLSKGLRRLIRFFLSVPITDTQCGLKGFTKNIKPVFLQTTIERYLFDLEFIRITSKLKHSIKPIQIELNENVQFRAINYRILLPEILNFLKLLLRRG